MGFPKEFRLSVPIHAERGFIGRRCGGDDCGRLFKVHKDDLQEEMHCPYCGERYTKEALLTGDQTEYLKKVIAREVTPVLLDEIEKMTRNAFKGPGWTYTPGSPRPIPPVPEPPLDPSADSELQCPTCSTRFQVDGIFGYCPGCKAENLLLYDANLAIMKRELAAQGDPGRQLRHAYADLVSTFEIFCRKEADRLGMKRTRMQNMETARQAFVKALSIDILAVLDGSESLDLRRAFQKRHVHEHNGGLIDDKYVAIVPEDAALLGTVAPLSVPELERAAMALRRVLAVLVQARQ
jgi:DNA-directed RNA polymerase subunit RPC12/RpoP